MNINDLGQWLTGNKNNKRAPPDSKSTLQVLSAMSQATANQSQAYHALLPEALRHGARESWRVPANDLNQWALVAGPCVY